MLSRGVGTSFKGGVKEFFLVEVQFFLVESK